MLILTRRVGETLKIGDDIEVTVLGLRGGQVRMGINAPKHIPVHREEIVDCDAQHSQGGRNSADSGISDRKDWKT